MNTFYLCEIIQFVIGLLIVVISYVMIVYHRKPLLDTVFGDSHSVKKSFATLTSMGYFMIFMPILLVGINLTPPVHLNIASHIQRIIYFEAGLLFLIGILHFTVMAIFSAKFKSIKT